MTRKPARLAAPKQIRRHHTYADDFVATRKQDLVLDKDEERALLSTEASRRPGSGALYWLGVVIAQAYCTFALHLRVKNRRLLRRARAKGGYVLYANHTQPFGDPCMQLLATFPNRSYVLASASNLGIPVIGRLLPRLGVVPVPHTLGGLKRLGELAGEIVGSGHPLVIFPEAHVWPWCGFVRPLPPAAFSFPVECGAPSYCMTTTYQRRRFGSKPRVTLYIDGPFEPDASLPKRAQKEWLHDEVQRCMAERSKASTYEYVRYERAEESDRCLEEAS